MTQTTVTTIEKIELANNPRNLAEYFMNQCRSWVESGDGFVPMMVAGQKGSEKQLVLAFEGFSGNMEQFMGIAQQMLPNALTGYCLLFRDAYVTTDEKSVERGVRVKNVTRKEAVVCCFVTKANNGCVAVWVYDRDADGKPAFTKNIEWLGEGITETIMEVSRNN
jgi:hypothetical protein